MVALLYSWHLHLAHGLLWLQMWSDSVTKSRSCSVSTYRQSLLLHLNRGFSCTMRQCCVIGACHMTFRTRQHNRGEVSRWGETVAGKYTSRGFTVHHKPSIVQKHVSVLHWRTNLSIADISLRYLWSSVRLMCQGNAVRPLSDMITHVHHPPPLHHWPAPHFWAHPNGQFHTWRPSPLWSSWYLKRTHAGWNLYSVRGVAHSNTLVIKTVHFQTAWGL